MPIISQTPNLLHGFADNKYIKYTHVLKNLLFSRVGVALDAWMKPTTADMFPKISQPLFLINAETFHWRENVIDMFKMGVNQPNQATYRKLITVM